MIALAVDLGCSEEVLRVLLVGINNNVGNDGINAKYEDRTALYLAMLYRRADLVEVLLQAGANYNTKSGIFMTPPIIIAAQQDVRCLEILLRHDPHQINWTDCNGVTALRSAVKHGNLETARFLIAHGADPTLGDREGRTPLSMCRSNDSFPILHINNGRILPIIQNRRHITRLLEEEDRAYFMYKGYKIHDARLVEEDYKNPRNLFSILHLPDVLKKRICRRQAIPQVLYTAQGVRDHPRDPILDAWTGPQQVQEVVYEVWGLKQDLFRELMGFFL